jgi:hypothetical protein
VLNNEILASKTYEEVRKEERDAAKSTPHEEDVGAEVGRVLLVADKVGGDDSDDAVPEPVGCGRETNTTGTDGEREDLADDDPRSRSPGGGERCDVQANEGNHSLDSSGVGRVVGGVLSSGGTDDTDNELSDNHETSTEDEKGTTANLLNHPEGQRSGEHVDKGGDHGDEERVADRAELLEEDSTKVKDEVDTGELLHHLHQYTKHRTAGVG